MNDMSKAAAAMGKCPVMHGATQSVRSNKEWWPEQLNLSILHQGTALSSPMVAGRIMVIWTRRAASFGQLSKNMASPFHGAISIF